MRNLAPATSRRTLLGALTATTAATMTPTWRKGLAKVQHAFGDEPVILVRTAQGRALSRARYHRAEEFFPTDRVHSNADHRALLYYAGITAQLGLSSFLLDVGFPDKWCAREIGLHVAKSLAYANASGLDHASQDMARLAIVLSPYNQWNEPHVFAPEPDDGGFRAGEVCQLLRSLLDRVHYTTGHPRPRGWHRSGRCHG